MSGGVMLPPFVVAPLIQTLRLPFGPHAFATTQGLRHSLGGAPVIERWAASRQRLHLRPCDRLRLSLDLL